MAKEGLPWWLGVEGSACQCRGCGFNPWSEKTPHAMEQLSLCAGTTEPTCYNSWSLHCSSLRSTPREATAMRSLWTTAREQPLFTASREKPTHQRRPSTARNLKKKKKKLLKKNGKGMLTSVINNQIKLFNITICFRVRKGPQII